MSYYITVSDNTQILEKIWFEDRTPALAYVERRRKQGYTVTIKVGSLAYECQKESKHGTY